MGQVFLSHAEEDRAVIEEIADGLESAGYTTWCYERNSVPGIPHLRQTREAIDESRAVLLLISPNSITHPRHVGIEVLRTINSDKPFVPLLLDVSYADFAHAKPDWADALEGAVATPVPAAGPAAILPLLVTALGRLGIEPQGAEIAVSSGEHARSHGVIRERIPAKEEFRPAPRLVECLRDTALPLRETGEGQARLLVPGKHMGEIVVEARELRDGTASFSLSVLGVASSSRLGQRMAERELMSILLRVSYWTDYVKATSVTGGRFWLAAQVPGVAVTPSTCEGLVRGLAALIDTDASIIGAKVWLARVDECGSAQEAYISVDSEQPTEVRRLLTAAGLSSGLVSGSFELDLGPETSPLSVEVSRKVISLRVSLPGAKPKRDGKKLSGLLDLNDSATVAKVGIDWDGNVTLHYDIPQAVPDLAERVSAEFSQLRAGVRTIIA